MSLPAGVSESDDVAVFQVEEHAVYHRPDGTRTACRHPIAGLFIIAAGHAEQLFGRRCDACWPDTAPTGLWPVVNGRA